jgi:hypothetical protein
MNQLKKIKMHMKKVLNTEKLITCASHLRVPAKWEIGTAKQGPKK